MRFQINAHVDSIHQQGVYQLDLMWAQPNKQEVKGVFGRLGKQEEVVVKVKEQEPRVTSTSEEKTQEDLRSARASASPGRGIRPNCTVYPC